MTGNDFYCDPGGNASTISAMKTPTKKSATKTEASRRAPRPVASRKMKTKPHAVPHKKAPHTVRPGGVGSRAPKMQKKRPTAVHQKPRTARPSARGPRSGDSDRGLYVRFETSAVKAKVKAAAESALPTLKGRAMNSYITGAVLKAIAEGWKPEMKPEAVESPEKGKDDERKTA